jgi:phenylacetate-CoA ligase
VEHVIDTLNDYRPDVLGSYGSYLEALFRMVAARDMDVHMPRAVLYFTDAMTDGGKRLLEDTLGIPVLSHYSAAEAFKIGFTCEERTGFHLHEDLTYVKIVDSSGRRLPPGEKGEVIISNLVNRGTVLLNYRLGDIAALSHEPCPCGRTFVMLSDLEGRVEDIIHLPDGSFVHPRLVWKLFKHRAGVLRYQLIQHALDTFELRLTTIDRSAFDHVIGEVIADLRQLLGQDAIIDAVYQAEFQPYTGAKFRPVLSLLKDGRELNT